MLLDNIFASLFKSSEYFRIVLVHLKKDYFSEKTDKILFDKIKDYYDRYGKQGSFGDIRLLLEQDFNVTVEDTQAIVQRMSSIRSVDLASDEQLLIDETEKWCRDRAMELAIGTAVKILEDDDPNRGMIEEVVRQALGIQFDMKVGHDYFADARERMERYFKVAPKIPLDIELLNTAMGGGLVKKAQFVFMANTNVGKTTWLCHCAASLLKSSNNVLYISAEMSEDEINKRVDANVLDISMEMLGPTLDRNQFKSSLRSVFEKTQGRLFVKEVPTGGWNAQNVRTLLQELKIKKNFVPDVVILDGLNNFASYKIPASQTGTPIYVKSVTEEMRALAQEFDFAELTVAQFNRGAKEKKQSVSVEDVGEAYAISQTADWAGAILQTDELREMCKYIIKVIKTRFGKNNSQIYTIGIDYDKMRLTNLDSTQQELPMHIKDQLATQQKEKVKKENASLFDFGSD